MANSKANNSTIQSCAVSDSSQLKTEEEYALFTWGFGKYGQLGNGENESKGLPQHIVFDRGVYPSYVSCGGHHTLLVLDYTRSKRKNKPDCRIVTASCGRGLYGRLGNGSEQDCNQFSVMMEPQGGRDTSPPVLAAAGHWHSAYVTMGGALYIWGYNKNNCTLGIPGLPPLVPSPTRVPLIGVSISHVSCGFNYTLAVTSDHVVYSWGCGRNGVLSQGDKDDRASPTVVSSLGQVEVVVVSAGYCHAAFISSDGSVYTCGKGSDGALGHGDSKEDKLVATLVQSLSGEQIASVSCSQGEHHSHTLMASSNGTVYSCGDGYKGKLGLGSGDDGSVTTPTMIPQSYFEDSPVTVVSAGGIHSVAIAPDMGVFVWGCGSDGRLGLPEAIGHRYLFRSNVPRKVDLGKKWLPVGVSSSYYHTAVLCRPKT